MVKKIKKADVQETEAYWKILRWFFSYPNKEMSLSDLSQVLEISKKTANKFVTLLVNEGFLRKEVLGKIWRISCNPNHVYNASRKIGYNLTLVYESGIRKMIWNMVPNYKAIVLFGSYRKGDDTEKSDVDIAVEVADKEELRIIDFVVPQLGYRKNVHVQAHIFSRDKIDLNLFSNVANGIVLEGFLEVRP